jgi:hypothetical protein
MTPILVLIHTPDIGEAIAANASDFEICWSLDLKEYQKGREQIVVAQVADLHPALIIIEMDTPSPWLSAVHSDSATRRIPMIAIAADQAARRRAAEAIVNLVYTPQEFTAALPDVITANARLFNQQSELAAQCNDPLSDAVLKGLHEFNQQEYFECHETLEAAWNAERGPVRELYRAILQVGIAYYQIQRRNYQGAHKMFLRSVQWFAPLPDRCQGINVTQLRADADVARAHLEALGPERIAEFDLSLLKPIDYEGMHQ